MNIMKLMSMRTCRSAIILFLAVLLAASPVTNAVAAGASSSRTDVWNEALLQFLIDEFGAEHALELYQWLQDVRLIDENGQIIRHAIHLDGQAYTLEEFRALLASGQLDLTKTAYIDGQPIPVEVLKTILELEDRLALLAENYRLRASKLTPEHLDSLISLFSQAGTVGLSVYGEPPDDPRIGAMDGPGFFLAQSVDEDSYNDAVYVTLTEYRPFSETETWYGLALTFRLSAPQSKTVSFDYELIPASLQSPRQTGTVSFAPGQVQKTVKIYMNQHFVPPDPSADKFTLDQLRRLSWYNSARADYLHFYNFRNFDYMITHEYQVTHHVVTFMPFAHAYEGGAYIAYAPVNYVTDPSSTLDRPSVIYYARDVLGLDPYFKTPEILEVRAYSGTYATGQIIPIDVLFSLPVMHMTNKPNPDNDPRLELKGGQVARPIFRDHFRTKFNSLSYLHTYQVVVEKGMTPDQLQVVKNAGQAKYDYMYYHEQLKSPPDTDPIYRAIHPDIYWNKPFTNQNDLVINIVPHRADAFKSIRLDKEDYKIGETAKVTVELENGRNEADWILNGLSSSADLPRKFFVSVGDRNSFIVPLDWARDPDGEPILTRLEGTFDITEELYQRRGSDGRLRAKIYYNRDSGTDGENPATFGMWRGELAYFTIEPPNHIEEGELEIVYPSVWPSGEAFVVYQTASVSTRLGYTFPPGKTYTKPEYFIWRSDRPEVADILPDGTIVPNGAGTVTFTLTATNGGHRDVQVTSAPITIRSGGDPAVVVPDFANRVYVPVGRPATVVWTTNVMQKYKDMAGGGTPNDAHFTVELFEGDWTAAELAAKTPVARWSAPAEQKLVNATSFTIPGEWISRMSTGYTPSYTVRISTPHPAQPSVDLSALAYIVVYSPPVSVALDKSFLKTHVTDDIGSIDLTWTLENFDRQNGGQFEFRVTKNGSEIKRLADSGTDVPAAGSYRLDIDAVDQGRLKDVYAVTLAAKNGLDDAWSYDSFYLQVYRKDAFRILVDGRPQTSVSMSNVDRIAAMDNDQRVALKRQIFLQHELGINHGDYADISLLDDQFIWESSNNDAAVINYVSSGRFANINTFGFPSYQPKAVFQLAGVGDGASTVTAIHAKTGVKMELDVTVETLRDKLYLFQFYPKARTTITYTDKKGGAKTAESNANGELALFDPDGIGSDVYATSRLPHPNDPLKTVTYTGVISHETVMSKERDPASMELYPINILQLRKLSEVEVYFKKPDGTPYTGKVTYRAGVYKNGEYAPYAEIGGSGETVQLGADGRLLVEFDTTKFHTADEPNAANLSAKDKIEIVLEAFFDNDEYYPQLLYFDGDTSPVDAIVFGGKIAELIKNDDPQQKTPFIVNQFAASGGTKLSIVNYAGKFGPNDRHPSIILTTEFMWWGEQVDESAAYAELVTGTEKRPEGQSYVTIRYPFSDIVVTRHQQVINSDTIWLEKAESGPVQFRLYKAPGQFRKSLVSRATLVNMIGVEEIDVQELIQLLEDLKKQMEQANTGNHDPGLSDQLVVEALFFLSQLNIDTGPLKMKVIPTDDPMVFETLIALNFGNMPEVASNPQGGGSEEVEFLQLKDYSFAPGLIDVYRIFRGTYGEKTYNRLLREVEGKHQRFMLYSFGGYFMGEIRYNRTTGYWEHIVTGGGFTAGGGIKFVKNMNTFVGPVPVTFSLTVGGGLEADFKASILYGQIQDLPWRDPNRYSVNDYLTSLRIAAYLELFGGVGFDLTVIAAKIGTFGRITIEDVNRWLNRDYLADAVAGERVKYGNMLTLEGIVGLRATLKALFLSADYEFSSYRYSHSWTFANWDKIEKYWNEHAHAPLTAANVDLAIAMYREAHGLGDLEVEVRETWTVEDRSYLHNGTRTWNAAPQTPFRLMALDPVNQAPAALQTNAYPYANPQLADDGSLFVYLSDGNSTAIEDTVAAWAKRTAGGYEDMGPITDDPALKGYGDSNLKVAGEGNLIAAVWIRQKETVDKDPGDPVRNEDIVLMTSSTEIMAAIYDGTKWTVERLTHNDTPDLAPVVAVGGGKVFVAYRSTGPSKVDNPFDFSLLDTIVYRVYDAAAKKWSDPRTLYNGTNGTVMGLAAAALEDGTAAVAYVVNEAPEALAADGMAGTGNEIVYAVIDTDLAFGAPDVNPLLKNLQVTRDGRTDENPQITTAVFPDDEERFVIAWHSAEMMDGQLEHDIKLVAVNADGEVYGGFVDSLSVLATHQSVKVQSNFAFARMKRDWRTLGNLSILWKEPETEFGEDGIVTRDSIKAVKFGAETRADGGYGYYLSGVIEVADMPDYTAADSIDAYVSDPSENEIKALILGTTYTTDAHEEHRPLNPGKVDGDDVPVRVIREQSAMYTATEVYANRFRVDETGYSPGEIVPGFDLPIRFRLVNLGMDRIESVTVTVGGVAHHFAKGTDPELLDFKPNESRVLTVYHEVPAAIKDEPYAIEAVFAGGGRHTETGMIRLDVPDVGISQVRIVEEKDGRRTLSVPVYNAGGATLAGKGRVVKLALYEDNRFTDEVRIGPAIEIRDDADLAMMDNGGYVTQIQFDLLGHLAAKGLAELPDQGLTVFLRVWAEEADGSVVDEFNYANNEASVWFESLARKYGEDGVLLTLEQTNDAGRTTVRLTMQNMRMAPVGGGNVLLNLLDGNGAILESRYVAAPGQPLTFGPEERIEEKVAFTRQGDSVQALYFTQSAPAAGVVLDEVAVSGVKVEFDPQKTSYRLAASDLKKTTVLATASRIDAAVTLLDGNDQPIVSGTGFISHDLPLERSKAGAENRFSIRVEADGDAKTYEFVLVNTETDSPKLELQLVAPKNADGDFVADVDVLVPAFDVEGYRIQKLRYRITSQVGGATADTGWIDVPYDGKTAVTVTTVKAVGSHTAEAEVVLEGGAKFALDRETFRIVLSDFDASASTVDAAPKTVLADGTSEAEIVVTLKDRYGHGLPGRTVSLRADGGHSVIRAVNDVTDAEGKAVFRVSNAHVETVGYIAKDVASGVEFPKVDVRFVAGVPDPGTSSVEAAPLRVAAGNRTFATVTVTVRDASGHPLPGREVELSADRANVTITATDNGMTGDDGKTAFAVRSARSGPVTLTAVDKAGSVVLGTVQVRFYYEEEAEESDAAPDDPAAEEPASDDEPEDGQAAERRGAFNEAFFPVNELRKRIADRLQAASGAAPAFPDAEGHWAARAITLLAMLDAIRGYEDGTFRPDRTVTRAEVASMLARLFPFPADPQGSGGWPADIAGHWAQAAIRRLIGLGLMSGYPDGTFRPDAPMTREEMVSVLTRLLDGDAWRQEGRGGFADEAYISAYAKEAVETAAAAGIVSGYPDGTFRPKGRITRAETASILLALLKLDPEIREMLESND